MSQLFWVGRSDYVVWRIAYRRRLNERSRAWHCEHTSKSSTHYRDSDVQIELSTTTQLSHSYGRPQHCPHALAMPIITEPTDGACPCSFVMSIPGFLTIRSPAASNPIHRKALVTELRGRLGGGAATSHSIPLLLHLSGSQSSFTEALISILFYINSLSSRRIREVARKRMVVRSGWCCSHPLHLAELATVVTNLKRQVGGSDTHFDREVNAVVRRAAIPPMAVLQSEH